MSRVRIVGGEWRRRLVSFHDAPGLRPTPDAVRETLFNWLGQDLSGLNCLDLFAGSGVLGFESASRGADLTTLVEFDGRVFQELKQNAATLGGTDQAGGRLELIRGDALKFAASTTRRYDVIFVDPPYNKGWLDRVLPMLPRILAPEGWVYAEAEKALEGSALLSGWQILKQGQSGQVHYHLLQLETPT